jgi:release factor glutamine methyltransferase
MVDQSIGFTPTLTAVVDGERSVETAGILWNDASFAPLLALGRALQARGYDFATPTPLTHSRVNARPENAVACTLRDFFGWSRPGPAALIPAPLLGLMRRAGILEDAGDLAASRLRFSTLQGLLFAHSRYPTVAADAVFFGPDTYRFAALIGRVLDGCSSPPGRVLDLGCGSGAGGIVAARRAGGRPFLVLADINPGALRLARVNAALAGIDAAFLAADLLTALSAGLRRRFDLIVANPPYLVDPAQRLYRDGGGALGGALSLRILSEAIAHLAPGGRLVLYTGSAIADGRDRFREQSIEIVGAAGLAHDYDEIDPDVFGEELEAGPYRRVERIAAVSLVVRNPA